MITDDLILQTITPTSHNLGDFRVYRSLPVQGRTMVGPFIFFDQAGPAKIGAGHGIDVRPHPHINLATVTYMYEGAFLHRDSLGTEQLIEAGAVNLMTAGKGIVHSERSPDEDRAKESKLSAIQTWLALPDRLEEIDPAFEHVGDGGMPVIDDGRVRARVIMGRYGVKRRQSPPMPRPFMPISSYPLAAVSRSIHLRTNARFTYRVATPCSTD